MIVGLYTGAIEDGGDLFSEMATDPRLNRLNCTGTEDSIHDCRSNTVNVEPNCPSAIAICQGMT